MKNTNKSSKKCLKDDDSKDGEDAVGKMIEEMKNCG